MSFLVNPFRYAVAGCTDADAVAFLAAAGITDATITSAICALVTSMKANGTWVKMQAIYPMVGGTATTHKFNLKNPADTNAAFRLGFVGGWTHSSNGALPNGTNAYANTFYSPLISGSQNSHHISYYSTSNTNSTLATGEIELGAVSSLGVGSILEIRTANITYFKINSANPFISAADTDSRAFYIGNRTASNVINGWRNVTKIANGTTASSVMVNLNYYLGAVNINGLNNNYSRKQCAFASIGSGLTDAEAATLYSSVQAFQTTLSRQV
jgi:hypothetical protein